MDGRRIGDYDLHGCLQRIAVRASPSTSESAPGNIGPWAFRRPSISCRDEMPRSRRACGTLILPERVPFSASSSRAFLLNPAALSPQSRAKDPAYSQPGPDELQRFA